MKITNLIFIIAIANISISYESKIHPFTDRPSLIENDFSLQLRENQETESSTEVQVEYSLYYDTVFVEEDKETSSVIFLPVFTEMVAVQYREKILINNEKATCKASTGKMLNCTIEVTGITEPEKRTISLDGVSNSSQDLYIAIYKLEVENKNCVNLPPDGETIPLLTIKALKEINKFLILFGGMSLSIPPLESNQYKITIGSSVYGTDNFLSMNKIFYDSLTCYEFKKLKNDITLLSEYKRTQELLMTFQKAPAANQMKKVMISPSTEDGKSILCGEGTDSDIEIAAPYDAKCKGIFLLDPNKEYTITYEDTCGKTFDLGKVTLKTVSPYTSYEPCYFGEQLLEKDSIFYVHFTTPVRYDEVKTITLVHVDNATHTVKLFPESISEYERIAFKVPKDFFAYGHYKGTITWVDNEIYEIPDTIVFYDGPLQLASENRSYTLLEKDFDEVLIETKNSYFPEDRFTAKKRISLPGTFQITSHKLSYEGKFFKLNLTTITYDKFDILLKDWTSSSDTIVFDFTIKDRKPEVLFSTENPYVIVTPPAIPKIPITLNFAISDFKDFKLTQTKKSKIPFNVTLQIGAIYQFYLEYLENSITEEFTSQFDSFEIVYSKDEEEITVETKEMLFIKESEFPAPVSESIKAKNKDLSIIIPFTLLLDTYQNYVKVESSDSNNAVKNVSIKNGQLLVTFSQPITQEFTLDVSYFERKVTISVKVDSCPTPTIQVEGTDECKKCQEINADLPYYLPGDICVAQCDEDYIVYEYQCLMICTDGLLEENKTCVSKCSSGYVNENGKCVRCSDIGKIEVNGQCVTESGKVCSDGLVLDENNACVLPENIANSTKENKCDDYCDKDHGTCKIENGMPICICAQDYYGLTCNIGKEKVQEYLNNDLFRKDNTDQTSSVSKINLANDSDVIQLKQTCIIISQLPDEEFNTHVSEEKQKAIIETASKLFLFFIYYRSLYRRNKKRRKFKPK